MSLCISLMKNEEVDPPCRTPEIQVCHQRPAAAGPPHMDILFEEKKKLFMTFVLHYSMVFWLFLALLHRHTPSLIFSARTVI